MSWEATETIGSPSRPVGGLRRPDLLAWVAKRGKQPPGQAGAVDQDVGPLTGTDVVERRGRRVGPLRADLAGEPERQQIRDQQHGRGVGQRRRRLAQELVHGVERQVLDAGHRVVSGRVDARVDVRLSTCRAVIAVMERQTEQPTVGIEQAVVDRPRVDAGRGDRAASDGRPQTGERLAIERIDVPVQAVGAPDGFIRETAYVVDAKLARADLAHDDSSVGRAEVHGRVGTRRRCPAHRESP